MKNLWLVFLALFAGTALHAANLTEVSFGDALAMERARPVPALFEMPDRFANGITADRFGRTDDILESQLLEDSGDVSSEQLFGAGVALGMAGNPIGLGLTGWFDFYLFRFFAISAQFQLGYGIITDPYENGGDAFFAGVSLGAKFVMDFPDVEINRWLRPFVALYPAGFLFVSATEEVEPPGTGDTEDLSYSDVFFHMYGGIGTDFFLTSNIALGIAVYVTGTLGGSKHKEHDVTIETEGAVGVYFEYARLTIRF